ncbi:MAG: cation-translocating P-type ATPase [Defluviitaleaceae bacterium]|nr:cation-translocating P-type ATPase [Defluviitaleaceae bacterium]
MKHYYAQVDEVLTELQSSVEGITAEQARERQAAHGQNKLMEAKKDSKYVRFAKQFAEPMVIMLIIAAVLSALTGAFEGGGLAETFIILAVVAINAVVGMMQESKAEQAVEALAKMSAQTCRVVREGSAVVINSVDLVPGDIVQLDAGGSVPADGRIVDAASLKIEEAALTGESVAADKTSDVLTVKEEEIPLGDRANMCFMGSTVVHGRVTFVVTATGMNTEMGRIAGALASIKDEKTPLQKRLAELSKILSYAIIAICAFIFTYRFIMFSVAGGFTPQVWSESAMIAVSLAVAAMPESLLTIVTVVLAIGVLNMSKSNAIIRRLTAVETLGCAQVICSDKTGTLTENKMTVVDTDTPDEQFLAAAMALCSDAQLDADGNVVGEPTEAALVEYALKAGQDKSQLSLLFPRLFEVPFDSERKRMTTVHFNDGRVIQFTKGAPDEVLAVCERILIDGEEFEITDEDRAAISERTQAFAGRGMRVLAAAFKEYDDEFPEDIEAKLESGTETIESGLTFIGLVGMIDPIRPEVAEAIAKCRAAGITPVMITGDHKDTAVAIAKQLDLIQDESQAITGAELDAMNPYDFERRIESIGVYARVKPGNKVSIVDAWRRRGYVCAMTGDGVNDSPSVKAADIGISMGITGTDVTKNAADMVLADDNFATIVTAVGEGRKIYDNIRKVVAYLLSTNLSEVLVVFLATVFGFIILRPVHLLWINLVTDVFPALALTMEKAEPDVMNRPPRDPNESIFAGGLGAAVLYQGVIGALLTVAAYMIGSYNEHGIISFEHSGNGITMAFLTLSFYESFHALNMRSLRGSLRTTLPHNKYLLGAVGFSLATTLLVVYTPFLNSLFGLAPVSPGELAIALGLGAFIIPVVEAVKYALQKRGGGVGASR